MAFADYPPQEHLRLAQAYSPANAQYIANKIRGGRNGRKGTEYENLYAAYALAKILVDSCLACAPHKWPSLFDQVPAFVDDLLIEAGNSHRYHQLKNVANITWESGDHPLRVDFELQKGFSDSKKEPSPITIAVVSSPVVKASLDETIPKSIADHTEVEHFPFFNSLNRLVQEFEPLRNALSMLARTEQPSLDEMEYALSALARAFMHQPGGGHASALLEKAQKATPGLLRLFPHQLSNLKLDTDFKTVLAKIPDFEYGCDRGFFSWKYHNDSGVLEYHCLNPQFDRFQRDIVKANPQTFDELEGYLL